MFIFLVALFLALIGAIKFTALRLGHDTAKLPLRGNLYHSNLDDDYETKTASIVKKFVVENSSGSTDQRLVAITQTRQALLDLRVPSKYQDLHLKLVIALSQLEAGHQGDADKLSRGQALLSEAIESQQWLRPR